MAKDWDPELLNEIHEHWVNPESREVWIKSFDSGEEVGIDFQMANKVIMNLRYLEYLSEEDPITVHLHTCGGETCQGMAIYDTIKSLPCWVTIIGYAQVSSMSSIVFLAGDERYLMPNAKYMIHYGDLSVSGESPTVWSEAKEDEKFADFMVKLYVAMSNFTTDEIEYFLCRRRNMYFSAEEAVNHGFADGIYQ